VLYFELFRPLLSETFMANTKSAKKAARQTLRRTNVNKARRSSMRTAVRKVEEALAIGNVAAAVAALKVAEPQMAKAAQKGVVHKNMVARKVSRLVRRIKALSA
jgi:small subunit ribosomal protein S20